ncbi:tumor necrosis factor receptor superfamily member 5-like [Tautogolabrus adspersus]
MDHKTSRPECDNCTKCDEGSGLKMNTSCTTVSDTVCEPLEGFYCSESKKDGCVEAKKHPRCEPGEYISENGTSSTDTMCLPCSNGTFSDGTSCQNHTQCESKGLLLLTPGTKTEDAQCGGKVLLWIALIICGVGGTSVLERVKSEESKEWKVEMGQSESSPGSCSAPAAGP